MARLVQIVGVERVLANLRRNRERLAERVQAGITRAGLLLQRESQRRVPVEYGVLKASAFTRVKGKGFKASAEVGYTAAYAPFVHEKVEMKLKGQPRASGKGRYWDPQGRAQAKFLEGPARELAPKLRDIILKAARITR